MKIFKRIFRLIYINYILLKLLLLIRFNNINNNTNNSKKNRGIIIRKAFENLGTIFVKCGQLLSTRIDLLPDDIAKELVKLQDKVPPFCGVQAKKIIETALGHPIEKSFRDFDIVPLASASISQVHSATLLNGQKVVIKVLRPNIEKQIYCDIELLCIITKLIQLFWKNIRPFKPYDIALEIKKNILDELDLMREAANASQLRRNFINSHLLYVPEVYWQYTKKNMLVLERIYGIPISNIAELKKHGANLKLLAERGVEIFFTQVFRDCFFHADMHPGNVWVSIIEPNNPKYMALDFGIIGTLGPEDQRYLAENFLAFFKRDYRKVAKLHVESGWVPKDTRIDEFESAIRCVCEPIFEKPLKDISFGKTLLRLLQIARRFNMQIQPQLMLLQKTLISIEGLGRQLYPDLDLWNTAKPFLEEWMRNRMGHKAIIKKIKHYVPSWLEKFPDMPDMLYNFLQTSNKNNIENQFYIISKSKLYKLSSILFGFLITLIILMIFKLF